WPPNEISFGACAFIVLERTGKNIGLLECRMLMQGHYGTWFHLEEDGGAALIVLVKDLHLDLVDVGILPIHGRRRHKMRSQFRRVNDFVSHQMILSVQENE